MVGFVGADGKGLAGLELKLNASLAGVEGKQTFESAPNGSKIPLGDSSLTPAKNGVSYQLTLDSEMQWAAQRRVAEDGARRPGPTPGSSSCSTSRPARCWPWPTRRAIDSARPQAAEAGGPRQPGDLRPVRAGQRAEGPHRRRADRLRHRHPGHQGGGARTGSPPAAASIKDHFAHGELRYNMRGVIANSSNIGTALLTRQLASRRCTTTWSASVSAHGPASSCPASRAASCRRPTWRTASATRWPSARPSSVTGDPGGGGDRRHRQRRRLPPADGDQGGERRGRPRDRRSSGGRRAGSSPSRARPRSGT